MYAIRAHLSMFPKWFVTITIIFIIQLVVAMTGYFNFSFMLVNLETETHNVLHTTFNQMSSVMGKGDFSCKIVICVHPNCYVMMCDLG